LRARRVLQGLFDLLGQVAAVDLAGESIDARELGEMLFALVAVIDDADEADGALRRAVIVGEPAAGILDPKLGRARNGAQRILGLIGDAAAAIGGLATIDRMRAPAAIDERRRDLVETVMVNSLMRMAQSNTPNHAVHAVTARSSMHVKHVTYQQAFPLKSGVAAVCLRRDPNRPLYRLCVAALAVLYRMYWVRGGMSV